jgi:glyoxylase-like metal-dependent hydrolase (beta-lactamase superfamily II)
MPDFEPVTDHILRLEIPWRMLGLVSVPVAVWLVRNPDGWTLVDTGTPESADQVVAAVARATNGQGPTRILLTHAHYDHGGGMDALRRAWNPPILCHRDEVPFVTGEAEYRHLRAMNPVFWLSRYFLARTAWGQPVARDLEGGLAASGMAVIHLPGHTPGQVGFFHPTDFAMICGDAVRHLGGALSAPSAFSTQDPHAARVSIRRLSELDFYHLLPSHGPPILDRGREAVHYFVERLEGHDQAGGW